jgi:MscS family membrane protein
MGRRSMRRQRFFIQVKYDTPREKLEKFVNGIRQLIIEHPMTEKDSVYIHFNDFGESGLDILIYYYLYVPDYVNELKEREKILLEILDLAKKSDIEFAFPTRTLHVETETGVNTSEDAKVGWQSQQ